MFYAIFLSMLRELSIKKFAIIDDLNINFSNGLTILSGETGAGKSIIINAVNLLLGGRATSKLIRTGAQAAELEALFRISPNSRVAQAITAHGFDDIGELLIRRVISRNNRHKIYINGHLSTIQILSSITENLASISGQHAHQGLLQEDQHLYILDQYGGLLPLRHKVTQTYRGMIPLLQQLSRLYTLQKRQAQQFELLSFQKKEIEDARIEANEDNVLEQERTRLKNSEAIFTAVNSSIQELYDQNGAVLERLDVVRRSLEGAAKLDPELNTKAEEIDHVALQIEDITHGLRDYLQNIQMDDSRLDEIEDRLYQLNKLKRKYGGSLNAVLSQLSDIDNALKNTENLSEKITEIQSELKRNYQDLSHRAQKLSAKRQKAAGKIAVDVERELAFLKMAHTRFRVDVDTFPADTTSPEYLVTDGKVISETGIDRAVFHIAPNIGEEIKPLTSIASGGELSRMVLALKAILADMESVETVVFDEVDAGVGGDVAEGIGKKLAELGRFHQIICITHLAQIAKFGQHHFKISKHIEDGRTATRIEPLSQQERINEIARMIGGENITEVTMQHAREILESAVTNMMRSDG